MDFRRLGFGVHSVVGLDVSIYTKITIALEGLFQSRLHMSSVGAPTSEKLAPDRRAGANYYGAMLSLPVNGGTSMKS